MNIFLERDFSTIPIKGRGAKGNILTKKPVHRIGLKSHGHSTLGGRKVWYDPDVNRLNYDDHGRLLGEFNDGDSILVILDNGDFYLTSFDVNNHFEDNIKIIEKFEIDKVWTAVLYDADNKGYPYLKRFQMDAGRKKQNYIGENPNSKLILLTDTPFPRIGITFGGLDGHRQPQEIDAESFTSVRSYKAHGKRLTTYGVESIVELTPTRFPEAEEDTTTPEEPVVEEPEEEEVPEEPEEPAKKPKVEDETGQLSLFSDEDM